LLAPPVGYFSISFGGLTYYRYGYDYYRPYWYEDRWLYVEVAPPVGLVVADLPPSPERVIINGQAYYRCGTTFYVEKPVAVAASPAAAAPTLTLPAAPSPAATIPAAATTNANAGATNAANAAAATPDQATAATTTGAAAGTTATPVASGPESVPPGYVVTKPPIGALVEAIPPGAKTVSAGSTTYLTADEIYYLPITVGDKTQYVVVQKP
jgi:hypothetical protein